MVAKVISTAGDLGSAPAQPIPESVRATPRASHTVDQDLRSLPDVVISGDRPSDLSEPYYARVHTEDVEHLAALVDLADRFEAHAIVRVDDGLGGWQLVEHRARREGESVLLERVDVTSREQERARVSRTEAYWRTILRNGHEAIVVLDPASLRVRHASDHLADLLGVEVESLHGRPGVDLVVDADRDALLDAIDSLDTTDRRVTVELRLRLGAGDPAWFEAVVSDARQDPAVAAVVVNLRDIGDRKQAEDRLRASEQLFRVLLGHLADGALVVDDDRTVRFASERVAEALGCSVEGLVGRPMPLAVVDDQVVLTDAAGSGLIEWADLPPAVVGPTGRWYELTGHDLSDDPVVDGRVLVFRDVTDRRRADERMRHELESDPLTGLLNRRGLEDRAAAWEQAGDVMDLAFLDLNGFKDVNDTYGHAIGDELLRRVAARLRGVTRSGDLVARLGGDEFVVVSSVASVDPASLCHRLLDQLAGEYRLGDHTVTIGVSVGWSTTGNGVTFADALRAADRRMYDDKRRQAAGR